MDPDSSELGEEGWRRREAGQFLWIFEPESYSAESLPQLQERAEAVLSAACELLTPASRPSTLPVRLVSRLAERNEMGWRPVPGGLVSTTSDEAVLLVAPEHPGEGLERAIVEIVARHSIGPVGHEGSGVLRGIAGFLVQPAGAGDARGEGRAALRQRRSHPAVTALFAPDSPEPRPATAEEVSFLAHIASTRGRLALGRFLRGTLQAVAEGSPVAVATAESSGSGLGQEFGTVLVEWSRALRTAQPRPSGGGDLLRRAVPLLRPYWLREIELVVYMLLDLMFGLAIPLSTKYLFDEVVAPGNSSRLVAWLVVVPSIFAVGSYASYRREVVAALIGESVRRDLRRRAFSRVQELSLRFYAGRSAGDLLARLTSDVDTVRSALGDALPTLALQLTSLVLAAAVVTSLDWILALIMFAGAPATVVLYSKASGRLRRYSRDLQDRAGEVSAMLQENLAGQMVVKSFQLEDRAVRTFETALRRQFDAARRMLGVGAVLSAGTSIMFQAVRVALLGIGAVLIMRGRLTVGDLVAAVGLMGQLLSPVLSISGLYRQLQSSTGAFDRIREVLDARPDVVEDPLATDLPPVEEEIRIDDLDVRYGQIPAVQSLSLVIPARTRVAVVGPSGSGKSTLIGLLLRLYDPDGGRILFDGRDIREATLASLRGLIAFVPQDAYLFNTTIRENIALGREDASEEDIVRAARAASVHDFIVERTEQGYDTVVGERGGKLSGGQRQRIALARALVRNPSILLLDEATSALDAESEAAVLQTLRQFTGDITTIMVTHRLASAVDFDLIFVLDRGQVVERGTHHQLYDRRGLYWRLYSEQQAGLAEALPLPVEARRLARVPIFASLPSLELARIALRLNVEQYPAGAEILGPAQPSERLYVVSEGEVEVLVPDHMGGLRRVNVLGPEGYFGEHALLGDGWPATPVSVRTLTPTELYVLDRDDFVALLRSQPGLAAAVDRLARLRTLQWR